MAVATALDEDGLAPRRARSRHREWSARGVRANFVGEQDRLAGLPGQAAGVWLPGQVVGDCAEDVQAILADLGISRPAVWGSSAGGPHALATAALLPHAAAAVSLFAPLASSADWWMDRWAERAGTDAAHSRLWADYLALCNRDGFGDGDEGWWEDWSASFQPWGADLAAIKAPVILWHGLQDTSPPPAHSRWLATRIPHVTAHFPAGEDHTNVEENNRAAAFAWTRQHI